MPVIVCGKIFVDQFAENGDIEIAEGVGNYVVGHRRHKYHCDPGDNAGHGKRQGYFGKYGKLISAEVRSCFQVTIIQFFQRGIKGKKS